MMLETFDDTEPFQHDKALTFLTHLDLHLSGYSDEGISPDYASILTQLDNVLKQMLSAGGGREISSKKKGDEASGQTNDSEPFSLNAAKMLSRSMVLVFEKLPSKIYDFANNLLSELLVDDRGNITLRGQISCIVLIDIVEAYPLQVASLMNYAATQIYKILKKDPLINSSIVFLLDSIIKGASKSDIDDKFSAKLVKLVSKTITQHSIRSGGLTEEDPEEGPAIQTIAYYIQVLKDLLILQVRSNYEKLLETSASATSSSKLKPEAIMAQQDIFQQSLLSSHEKVFLFGLQSHFAEVRAATSVLLAGVLSNFVATGKFSPPEYLIKLYPMPDLNLWDGQLTSKLNDDGESISGSKKEFNLRTNHDSEAIITSNLGKFLLQAGTAEALVLYVQLESLQNKDYLTTSITSLIDMILLKFDGTYRTSHIQNGSWVTTLSHWTNVLGFLMSESGSSTHDILTRHVMQHFSSSYEESSQSEGSVAKPSGNEKRSETGLFKFKGLKKSKKKGGDSGQINLYTNPYQLQLVLTIVSKLVFSGVDFNSLIHNQNEDHLISGADEVGESVDEDENKSTAKGSSYISDLLTSLLANECEYIRNYSLVSLLEFSQVNPSESNRLSLELFALVKQEFTSQDQADIATLSNERNISQSGLTRLLSYSLALSALIKQTDITLLQNSTVAKLLSFCTQNLKHNSSVGSNNSKNASCWVILSALVTFYHDSEFVKLNSSQFLVFWKNLLTSQFVTSALSGDSSLGDTSDVIQNLKLRSFSLLCLLNYISTVESAPDVLKQLQFLLVKSHKYLVFLESEYEISGSVTSFNPQAFNESDYNPDLMSNVLFSNYFNSEGPTSNNQLISLMLYHKKLVIQGFVKIAHSLKGDVNSSLVVLLLKVFADPKMFSRLTPSEYVKEKTKASKVKHIAAKVVHQDTRLLLLDEDYNYHFGVTSKFQNSDPAIDELCCRSRASMHNHQAPQSLETYLESAIGYKGCIIGSSMAQEPVDWTDSFEGTLKSLSSHSVNFDPAVLILHRYSLCHAYSTTLTTSLVDLSIELFQQVFWDLSNKIQFSLLEQLRSALVAKQIDPLRREALLINISVAVHGLLNELSEKGSSHEEDLVLLLLEIIELIETTNSTMISICADSMGLAARLLSKAKVEDLIATMISKIVTNDSPLYRGRCISFLSKINHHTHTGFLEIHDVVVQLMKDPHPITAFYSLQAACVLFENPLGNQSMVENMLCLAYDVFISKDINLNDSTSIYANLRMNCNFSALLANLIKVCVTTLGPRLRDCHVDTKVKTFQLLLLMSRGIGCSSMKDLLASITTILSACQECIIFDPALAPGFSRWFKDYNLTISRLNSTIGTGIVGCTSINTENIFPLTTSDSLFKKAIESLAEMTKIGIHTLDKMSSGLVWSLMELKPCRELETLVSYWVDANPDARWFQQLTVLFNMSSRKLTGRYLEVNYQQKLLPLEQRQKKANKDVNVNFTDEESQNIVEFESEVEDQNQSINWQFRSLIYDLLNKILAEAKNSASLSSNLKSKVQEIVRISFLGTTAPTVSVKVKGVDLLRNALDVFGHLEDPVYPGVSILEQQQAQIISALIPCFSSDSDAKVIVQAIDVSSKFINLPRINFYSKQRILRTMIYLLEEVSSNKFLKFVHLESMAEYGKKSIQLAILNCWAVLYVNFSESNGTLEPEFEKTLAKYSKLLISLWILSLKEFSNLKYNQPGSRELSLYNEYWLNFVGVLSLILRNDAPIIEEYLQDEKDDFFFVMFCQCSEALIKNHDVPQVLDSVNILVKISGISRTLFSDDVFGEVIDLLDRLILTEKDVNTKSKVVDTVNALFESYPAIRDPSDSSNAKYFELMRVAMLPLFEIFPFLRQDFDPQDQFSKLLLEKCDTENSLVMANKQFGVLSRMVQNSPTQARADLVSCMLYLIAKFYEYGNDALIITALPFLKAIVSHARDIESQLLDSFIEVLQTNGFSDSRTSQKTYMITMIILITGGNIAVKEVDLKDFAHLLIEGLSSKDLAPTSFQSIRSIINHAHPSNPSSARLAKVIFEGIYESLVRGDEGDYEPVKTKFDLVFLFMQPSLIDSAEKVTALYRLIIPLLVEYDGKTILGKKYLHDHMMSLMSNGTESFKKVVKDHMSQEQKLVTESLVKYSDDSNGEPHKESIQLKSFV